MVTTNETWFCYTNHSLTMVFVVKLWIVYTKNHDYYTLTLMHGYLGIEHM